MEEKTPRFGDLGPLAGRPLREVLDALGMTELPRGHFLTADHVQRCFDWIRGVLALATPHRGVAKFHPKRDRIEELFVEGEKLVRELSREIDERELRRPSAEEAAA